MFLPYLKNEKFERNIKVKTYKLDVYDFDNK